ncbi:hypothetical protein ACTJI2_02225 [Pseudoxanthomonas sp. 22568]
MKLLSSVLTAEAPPFAVAAGVGLTFGYESGFVKGVILFAFVFLVLQPFVLFRILKRK